MIKGYYKSKKTAHNRSVYASGPLAPRPPQRLGHSATLHSHAVAPAYFASPGLATQALIRTVKTSYTAGTLCEMGAKIIYEFLRISIDKIFESVVNIM
jgi:hypothetical protein